jgi:hypothetical protein
VACAQSRRLCDALSGVPVALTFTGKLENNGETVTLSEPGGGVIFNLTYNNVPPWPAAASGSAIRS